MMILSPILCLLTTWLTYYFIRETEMTPTRVSALISLIIFLILIGIGQVIEFDFDTLCLLTFGASFVGMCSHKIINPRQVLLASLVYCAIFIFLRPYGYGVGGALGFSAFCSIMSVKVLNLGLRKIFA